ncbi:2-C-methyl-D-erythritol 2,4-cyclodiphosphate synthase [Candidatus Bipolaricaulota bacterium]|nr:2-C-methyl-D-erythritol 2,4-cyclodiphosphate synthase [Candidatus Bipolaricaulota bacterium]
MNEEVRVGLGVDFHLLREGESLVLGGVEFDYHLGTVAHSDGDVLLHAICDALLGAASLGDIGENFPDDDPAYKDISSLELLRRVTDKLSEQGFQVVNVDSTLIIEKPRVGPERERMVEVISGVVSAPVNVKATTTEGLGFIGSEDGVGAQAVAALRRE